MTFKALQKKAEGLGLRWMLTSNSELLGISYRYYAYVHHKKAKGYVHEDMWRRKEMGEANGKTPELALSKAIDMYIKRRKKR